MDAAGSTTDQAGPSPALQEDAQTNVAVVATAHLPAISEDGVVYGNLNVSEANKQNQNPVDERRNQRNVAFRVTPPRSRDVHPVKIVLVGDVNVGKSSLLLRLVNNEFSPRLDPTIGFDCKSYAFGSGLGRVINMQLWDTAGQERFQSMTAQYYRNAHGVVFVFDMSRRASFDALTVWMLEVDKSSACGCSKLLLGNKCDSECLQVSICEAEEFAHQHQMLFFETSAKDSRNVEQAFQTIGNSAHGVMQSRARTNTSQCRQKEEECRLSIISRKKDTSQKKTTISCCS